MRKRDILAKGEHANSSELSSPEYIFLSFFILYILASPFSFFLSRSLNSLIIIYIIRVTGHARESFESAIDIVLNVGDVLIDRLIFSRQHPVSLESCRKSRDSSQYQAGFERLGEFVIMRILESIEASRGFKGGRESVYIMRRQFQHYGIPGEDYYEHRRRDLLLPFRELYAKTILLKLHYGHGDTDRPSRQPGVWV